MEKVLSVSLLASLVCLCSMSVNAQISEKLPRLTTEQWRTRRISVASETPLRINGDRLYDLTEVLRMHNGIAKPTSFILYGTVIEIVKDGFLIETYPDDKVAVVKNHPSQKTLTDGTRFRVVAFLQPDPYHYTAVNGATRTVPLYDWGKPYAGSGRTFTNVTRVCSDAIHYETVPFSP